jgi:hypothetical protein
MEIRETAAGKRGQKLREGNKAFEDRGRAAIVEAMRSEIKGMTGVDILSDKMKESGMLDIFSPGFSLKGLIESVQKGCRGIREANVAGTVQQFLRAGIQLGINPLYQKVETTWDGLYQSLPSNKAVELYAAAFRSSFPKLKGFGEEPDQAVISGLDIQVPNRFVAKKLLTIGKDLVLFDQTNQVQQQAQQIAENFPIFSDSHAVGRFISNSATGSYAVLDANGDAVPVSATGAQAGESTWPYNVAFTNGAGKNRLTTFTAASYETIIQLRAMARQMKDPLGHKMLVNPETIWCGVGLTDGFELMLKSALWPSTASISSVASGGAVKTDMAIGVQHADNILKGKYNLVDSIWLPNTAYGICQAAKGFIKQVVQPVKVAVENPMSGASFLLGGTRYLIDEIWTYEWIEPRYSLLGSEGSA